MQADFYSQKKPNIWSSMWKMIIMNNHGLESLATEHDAPLFNIDIEKM